MTPRVSKKRDRRPTKMRSGSEESAGPNESIDRIPAVSNRKAGSRMAGPRGDHFRVPLRRDATMPPVLFVAPRVARAGGSPPCVIRRGGDDPQRTGGLRAPKAVTAAVQGVLPRLPNGPAAFAPRVIKPIDDQALTAAIDRLLAARWASSGVTPAPAAGDAEFLRRVSLDIAGRIPAVAEAREFLDDPAPGKRRALVERLLAGPGYAEPLHRRLDGACSCPTSTTSFQLQYFAPDFEAWLRRSSPRTSPTTRWSARS